MILNRVAVLLLGGPLAIRTHYGLSQMGGSAPGSQPAELRADAKHHTVHRTVPHYMSYST